MPAPTSSSSPPTGRIHAGPPVLATPPGTSPAPSPPRPEPDGAVVLVVALDGAVVAVDPDVVAVVDDVSPAAAVVAVDPASDVDVDDDVDAAFDVSSFLSPRFPGCAIARTTPTTNSRAVAAPRIANRPFRGNSPRLDWSG